MLVKFNSISPGFRGDIFQKMFELPPRSCCYYYYCWFLLVIIGSVYTLEKLNEWAPNIVVWNHHRSATGLKNHSLNPVNPRRLAISSDIAHRRDTWESVGQDIPTRDFPDTRKGEQQGSFPSATSRGYTKQETNNTHKPRKNHRKVPVFFQRQLDWLLGLKA